MGTVYAELTLTNAGDTTMVRRGLLKPEEVRSAAVQFVVDTGADPNVISEATRAKLGLEVAFQRTVSMASGEQKTYDVVEPIEIRWKDRAFHGDAMIIPAQNENILGVTALEQLDLCVDPVRGELFGRHGNDYLGRLY